VLASVYMLRAFIRAMHNRVGPKVDSREITWEDGFVLVPLVLAIIALSLYPAFGLKRSERSVNQIVGKTGQLAAGSSLEARR
jgi:NADH-quinone oxidoreductase subunit M